MTVNLQRMKITEERLKTSMYAAATSTVMVGAVMLLIVAFGVLLAIRSNP